MPPVRQLSNPVASRPIEDEFAHWTPGAFKCRCPGCGGREYPARLYGPWAVFEHDELGWELLHIKTRLAAVSRMKTEEDCFRVGDFLQRRFPLVWRLGVIPDITAKLRAMDVECGAGSKISAWAKQCGSKGKFIAPNF